MFLFAEKRTEEITLSGTGKLSGELSHLIKMGGTNV